MVSLALPSSKLIASCILPSFIINITAGSASAAASSWIQGLPGRWVTVSLALSIVGVSRTRIYTLQFKQIVRKTFNSTNSAFTSLSARVNHYKGNKKKSARVYIAVIKSRALAKRYYYHRL